MDVIKSDLKVRLSRLQAELPQLREEAQTLVVDVTKYAVLIPLHTVRVHWHRFLAEYELFQSMDIDSTHLYTCFTTFHKLVGYRDPESVGEEEEAEEEKKKKEHDNENDEVINEEARHWLVKFETHHNKMLKLVRQINTLKTVLNAW